MPTLKRFIDLPPIGSGEQKLPGRFQYAADSSGNRRFIFLQFAKNKAAVAGHTYSLIPHF